MSGTLRPSPASAAARLSDSVVFPQPPFWLITARITEILPSAYAIWNIYGKVDLRKYCNTHRWKHRNAGTHRTGGTQLEWHTSTWLVTGLRIRRRAGSRTG